MLSEILDSIRDDGFARGEFRFRSGESLAELIEAAEVPGGAGVYLIWAEPGSELLYVGKSGTIHQDGHLGDQGLSERLRKKQDGVSRQQYFESQVAARGLEGLRIEWIETYRDRGTPPFLAEAQVLAAFLKDNGVLPALNKSV